MYASGMSDIDVRKKWMWRHLMFLLLLFRLPFNLCSTTLVRHTRNCADARGADQAGGATCGKTYELA
jgi:hypothetical protein